MMHVSAIAPALHAPSTQLSRLQLKSPGKLHVPPTAGCWQSDFASQTSVVQTLPSSQLALWVVWLQPLTGSQASNVQPTPSSQFNVSLVVSHKPFLLPQCSNVHTLPSLLQAVVTSEGTATQPFFRSHTPAVHAVVLSAQGVGLATCWQAPFAQTSSVQATLSGAHGVLSTASDHAP